MAVRRALPVFIVAAAFATLICAPSFMCGSRSTTALRSKTRTGSAALPELGASVSLAESVSFQEISTPGWWASIVTLIVPIAVLLILYNQSERNKRQWDEEGETYPKIS
eukprot:TRINITY_DN1730_c0_g1_i1.p1 TRINITY_DN1730_c0_g1~~TRINITY_DN1730_c0_g1_i1.p1  ORF type:complete len:109 (+),score=16.27 TRINITY_DN1730_c0_g1_i1:36-362(+)